MQAQETGENRNLFKTAGEKQTNKDFKPANVPAKDFWAVTMYDTQTRSQLQTDQGFPTLLQDYLLEILL